MMIRNVTDSDIEDAIRIHWRLQLGTYFASVHDLDGAVYNLGGTVADYFWNYAGLIRTSEAASLELLNRVLAFAASNDRVPAFYIDPTVRPSSFTDLLRSHGFAPEEQEMWMFFPTKTESGERSRAQQVSLVDTSFPISITRVVERPQMSAFLQVFLESYGMLADGQTTSPYSDSLLLAYNNPPAGVEVLHYLGEADGEAVSVASVYISGDVAGVYNVGTPERHRRRGYAAALSSICIREALSRNVRRILLQTELGSPAEQLYLKLGFQPAFSAGIWCTDKES